MRPGNSWRAPTHADFLRVDLTKPVHATVPLVLVGKAEGVKLGGIMHQVIRILEIACTPDKIPAKVEIDVSQLGMNEALHVRDIKLLLYYQNRTAHIPPEVS